MLAVFFYAVASLLLSVMIINANGPVIDYSHLSKPTATFPPTPVPAVAAAAVAAAATATAGEKGSLSSQGEDFGSLLADEAPSKLSLQNKRSSSLFSLWLSLIKGSRRSRKVTATTKVPLGFGWDHVKEFREMAEDEEEERPQKSMYSPPAAYSYPIEEHDRHSESYNKSGFCHTETPSRQEQRQHRHAHTHEQRDLDGWKAHMQINLPIKP